jgi:Leucine-rich repeat (LRR) protein
VQLQLGRGLEELHLERCGPFVAHGGTLQHFSRLRSLEVDANWSHRPGYPLPPKALKALTSLTRLRLSTYGLLEVPAAVLALTGLHSLDLSNNRLSSLGGVCLR